MTDANVVLGFLPPSLAGGTMKLDVPSARVAIGHDLAKPLGLSVEDAAFGVREVANINMARAIRAVTVERGVDPRDFTLLAFGGSGPVHACDLADTLGISRVMFPRAPGVFTAMGMLAGNVERYFLRPMPGLLHQLSPAAVNGVIGGLRREAIEALAQEDYSEGRVTFAFELDLRFRGQDSELPIALAETVSEGDHATLRETFLAAYRQTYGYASSDDIETVNIRLRASGISGHELDFAAAGSTVETSTGDSIRLVYFDRRKQWVETPVRSRSVFSGEAEGPLILESPDTTIVIPPRALVTMDRLGNIVANLGRSKAGHR